MKGQIAMFLINFNKLKIEVCNAPSKLIWLAKEREDIQDLCHDVHRSYHSIKRLLTTKDSKHTFIDVHFEKEFKEYELNYTKNVSKAAGPAEVRRDKAIHEVLLQIEGIWLKSGKTKEEFSQQLKTITDVIKSTENNFDPFDPLKDDPHTLISEALDWGNLIKDVVMEDDEPERYEKAWGAWRFFTDRFCLNFSEINKKWLNAPDLYIQTHVSQSEETPIVQLYNEAVRAYALGCNNASITMCRALMEHILKKHYKVNANNLEERIDNAAHLFPQFMKPKLHKIRKKGNEVLHYYESGTNIKDLEVTDCLSTIKILVQGVPKKNIF
jgi:hypothetical protein